MASAKTLAGSSQTLFFYLSDLSVMNRILHEGKALYDQVLEAKLKKKEVAKEEALALRKRLLRRPEDKLRNRDPWG